MVPQKYSSYLESRTPFVFQNIKANPTELHPWKKKEEYKTNNYLEKQKDKKKTKFKRKNVICYLINVRMIYLGEKSNLLQGKVINHMQTK